MQCLGQDVLPVVVETEDAAVKYVDVHVAGTYWLHRLLCKQINHSANNFTLICCQPFHLSIVVQTGIYASETWKTTNKINK